AKHGTTIETRLTVIDKAPAEDPTAFPTSPGIAPDVVTLIGWIAEHVPPRSTVAATITAPVASAPVPKTVRGYLARGASTPAAKASLAEPEGVDLAYETVDW